MSIEISNPTTLLAKVDAVANLVNQMHLAHMVKDENRFEDAYKKVCVLIFDKDQIIDSLAETN